MNRDVSSLPESAIAPGSDKEAGFGALETDRGRLPLTAMDVTAQISGLMAQIQVRQTFRNSLDETLEAAYIFPLPDRAAVTRFQMRVAGRTIDGQLKERGQAREEYDEAIARGHRAAIAEEDRSGVFQLRVGNLPPREEAVVELTLVSPLPVADGEATFRFPLVVAPRYTPGVPLDGPSVGSGVTPDTDQVPDASRVTPPVLLPGFPNPVALSLEVELDPAGIAADGEDWSQQIRSSLHSIITSSGPPWKICLQPGERLNRDFILRYPVVGSALSTTLVCSPAKDGRPGTFALTLFPPKLEASAKPAPRRIVFVLDRSGSMEGWKLVAARRAVGRMVDTLLDQDEFTVLAFDNTIEELPNVSSGFVPGTDRHRWQALEWLGKINARGGTEMGPALKVALERCSDTPADRDPIVILVTDGQITGEDATLRNLSKRRGKKKRVPRIFTVGIDRAVNAGFLRRLADFGQGECELVESEDRLDQAMDRIHRLMGRPVLTQVRLESTDDQWIEGTLAPQRVPDLHADRPVTVFGRHHCDQSGLSLLIHGIREEGRPWQYKVTGQQTDTDVLHGLWGRAKVRELEDEYAMGTHDPKELMQRIVNVSLDSHVLSRFTAYVAVDGSEIVSDGQKCLEIVQPVEVPDGWHSAPIAGAYYAYYDCVEDVSSGLMSRAQMAWSARLHRRDSVPFESLLARKSMRSSPPTQKSEKSESAALRLRRKIDKNYTLRLERQDFEETKEVVRAIVRAAIEAGTSGIYVDQDRNWTCVWFKRGGMWIQHAELQLSHFDELFNAISILASIDPNASSWPQEGEVELEGVRLTVTFDRRKNREFVMISILAQQCSDPGETTDRKKRFWS